MRLFGGLALLSADGEPVALSGRKERELLVALSLRHGREVSRERLVADLWDSDDFSARRSLNTALWRLRKAVREAGVDSDEWFDTGADYIRLRRRGVSVDLVDMQDRVEQFRRGRADAKTVAMFLAGLSGHFLPNLTPEWLEERRQQVETLRVQAAIEVADALIQDEPNWAVELTNSAIRLDPYEERAWQALISAYLSIGSRAQAHATYAKLEALLEEELGIAPSMETQALMRDDSHTPDIERPHSRQLADPKALFDRLGTVMDALALLVDELNTIRSDLGVA